MIFKAFRSQTDLIEPLNRYVNGFIEACESSGMRVEYKTVHVVSAGDNSLIKPDVIVTVWMENS